MSNGQPFQSSTTYSCKADGAGHPVTNTSMHCLKLTANKKPKVARTLFESNYSFLPAGVQWSVCTFLSSRLLTLDSGSDLLCGVNSKPGRISTGCASVFLFFANVLQEEMYQASLCRNRSINLTIVDLPYRQELSFDSRKTRQILGRCNTYLWRGRWSSGSAMATAF